MALSVGLVLATLLCAGWGTAAYAGPGESGFASGINSARANHGLAAYAVAADLTSMARAQAGRMAAKRTIFHNPNLAADACCWTSLGENVGVGGDAGSLTAAFLASPEHRANILSSAFTQVGIGTAVGSDGRLYVDEVFRRPDGAATPNPTSAPKSTSTPKPTVPKPTATTVPKPTSTTTTPASAPTTAAGHPTAPAGTTSNPAAPSTTAPAGAASPAATANPAGTLGASRSDGHSAADRANRSEQRAALPDSGATADTASGKARALTAAQRSRLSAAAKDGTAGDPLARSLAWWRAMHALAG
jgi:Cysteine-rich secretory protein family